MTSIHNKFDGGGNHIKLRVGVRLLIFAFFFTAQVGCASFHFFHSGTVEKDVVYKSVDGTDLKGDLYLPDLAAQAGPHPAVLVVHGGSWSSRSGDMEFICWELSKAGFVAFNVTYRLAPKSLYPKALEDVKDAARWLQARTDLSKPTLSVYLVTWPFI